MMKPNRKHEPRKKKERVTNRCEKKKKHSTLRLRKIEVVLRKLKDINDCCLSTHGSRHQPSRACKHTVHSSDCGPRSGRDCSKDNSCEELLKSWKAPTRVHRLPKRLQDFVLDKTVLHLIEFNEWYYSGRVAHDRACKKKHNVSTHHAASKNKKSEMQDSPELHHTKRQKRLKVNYEKQSKRKERSMKHSSVTLRPKTRCRGRPRKQETTCPKGKKKRHGDDSSSKGPNSTKPKQKKLKEKSKKKHGEGEANDISKTKKQVDGTAKEKKKGKEGDICHELDGIPGQLMCSPNEKGSDSIPSNTTGSCNRGSDKKQDDSLKNSSWKLNRCNRPQIENLRALPADQIANRKSGTLIPPVNFAEVCFPNQLPVKKVHRVGRCRKNKIIPYEQQRMSQSKKKAQEQTGPSLESTSCALPEGSTKVKSSRKHRQHDPVNSLATLTGSQSLKGNSTKQHIHKKARHERRRQTVLKAATGEGVASVLRTQSDACSDTPATLRELHDENNNVITPEAPDDTVQAASEPLSQTEAANLSLQSVQEHQRRITLPCTQRKRKPKRWCPPVPGKRRSKRLLDRENSKRHRELWTCGNTTNNSDTPGRRSVPKSVGPPNQDVGICNIGPGLSEKASVDDLLQELASICPLTGDLPFSPEDCLSLFTESPIQDGGVQLQGLTNIAEPMHQDGGGRNSDQGVCPKSPPLVRRRYLEYLMDEFSLHLLANQPEKTPPWRRQERAAKRVSFVTKKGAEMASAFGPLSPGVLEQLRGLGLVARTVTEEFESNLTENEPAAVRENSETDQGLRQEPQKNNTVRIQGVEYLYLDEPILLLPDVSKNQWGFLHVLEVWLPSSVLHQDAQNVYFHPLGHWSQGQGVWQVQMALWKNQESGAWSLTHLQDPGLVPSSKLCFVPEETWLKSQGVVAPVCNRRVYIIQPSPVVPLTHNDSPSFWVQPQSRGPFPFPMQLESFRSQNLNPTDRQKKDKQGKGRKRGRPRILRPRPTPDLVDQTPIPGIEQSMNLQRCVQPFGPLWRPTLHQRPMSMPGGVLPSPTIQQRPTPLLNPVCMPYGPSLMPGPPQKLVSVQSNNSSVMLNPRDGSFPGGPGPYLRPVLGERGSATYPGLGKQLNPSWGNANQQTASQENIFVPHQDDVHTQGKALLSLPAGRIGTEPKGCFTVSVVLNSSDPYNKQMRFQHGGKKCNPNEQASMDDTLMTVNPQEGTKTCRSSDSDSLIPDCCNLATTQTDQSMADEELLRDINNNPVLQECVQMLNPGNPDFALGGMPTELPSSAQEAIKTIEAYGSVDGLGSLLFDWCAADLRLRSNHNILAKIDQRLALQVGDQPAESFCTFAASFNSLAKKANYVLSEEDESLLVQLGLSALHRCQVQEPVHQQSGTTRIQVLLDEQSKTQSSDRSQRRHQEAYCILHMMSRLHLPLTEVLASSSKLLPWLLDRADEEDALLVMSVVTTLTEFDPAMAFSVIQGIGWSHSLWVSPGLQKVFPGHLAALAEALLDCDQSWPCRTVLSHLVFYDGYSGSCRHLYNGLLNKLLGASAESSQGEAAMEVFEDMMDFCLVVSAPSISRLLSMMWEQRKVKDTAWQDAQCIFHYGLGLGTYPMYRKVRDRQWETTLYLGATEAEVFFTMKMVLDELQHWCIEQVKVISKNVQRGQQQSTRKASGDIIQERSAGWRVIDLVEHHARPCQLVSVGESPSQSMRDRGEAPGLQDAESQVQALVDEELRNASLKIKLKKPRDVCEDILVTDDQTSIEAFTGMLSMRSLLAGVLQEFFHPLSVSLCADPQNQEDLEEQRNFTFAIDPEPLRSWLVSASRL